MKRAVLSALLALGLTVPAGAQEPLEAIPEAPAQALPGEPAAQAEPAVQAPPEPKARRRAVRVRREPARTVLVPDTVVITPPGQVCQVERDRHGRPVGCVLAEVPGQVAVRERRLRLGSVPPPRRGAAFHATDVEPRLSASGLAWSLAPSPGPVIHPGPFVDPWPNFGFRPTVRYKPVAGGYGLHVSPGPPPTELPGLLSYP